MVLSYQGGDKLKVPIDAFDRVQKYASAEGARPAIDKLGSGSWEKVKKRVKKAMRDMAAELLRLYAERKARPGHAFTAESPWQREFEEAFEYEETPDQAAAIADVAADMASESPMDRLICGDVGYGKTEVAMRGRDARRPRRQAGGGARRPPRCWRSSTGRRSASASRRSR